MFDIMLQVLPIIFSPVNIFTMIVAVTVGITIGALPGLTATMGVALALPFTFGMNPTTALLLLAGIYCGGIYGGSVTAILIRTPGTPASAATVLDGYPLARSGRAKEALDMALYASTFGGIVSVIALLVFAPQLAKFALKFGPPENFMLAMFGLTIIISISSGAISKGLLAGCLGLLISTVGIDPMYGTARFTFGVTNLLSGFSLVPSLIGLFAVSQVFEQVEGIFAIHEKVGDIKGGKSLSIKEFFKHTVTMLKSSIIGIIIGALPGTGGAIASFLSYNEARRTSKDPDSFGKGNLDGIAASEAGNNGVTGATLIPLLTLGIPGDVTTAVMLGALLIQGLIPGPRLFQEHANIAYSLIFGMFAVNIIMLLVGIILAKPYSKVVEIPANLLVPIVAVLCIVGAFSINNSIFDVATILVLGIVGYILPKFEFPLTPMLLGIILGPMAETGLRQGLIMSNGSWMIFLTRPISLFFFLLSILFVGISVYKDCKARGTDKADTVLE